MCIIAYNDDLLRNKVYRIVVWVTLQLILLSNRNNIRANSL